MEHYLSMVLSHANWTGLTLADLLDAGRITPTMHNLLPWVRDAIGQAASIEDLRQHREIAQAIIDRVTTTN